MTRTVGYVVLGSCLFLASRAGGGQAPVFHSSIDAVRVYATVTNGDGQLVPNLSREVFEVKADGVVQPISVFDNTPVPIRLIILLDLSCSVRTHLPLMTAGAEQLLMRLRPGDLARVATFGGSQRTTMSDTFSDDFASLSNALRRKTGTCGNTPLWPALYSVMEAFEPIRGDERAVVLVFSDGADSGGNIRDVDVIDRARRGAVMIYSIAMQGIDYATSTNSFRALTTVAAESGGGFTDLPARKDISAAFARVADELHAQYLIGFEPPKRDGREHRIDVRSLRRGLKVRARKSYLAPMP